jgi:hypothetical protein
MPFYADYSYHPLSGTTSTEINRLFRSSIAYRQWVMAVVEHYKNELEKSSDRLIKSIDKSRIEPLSFE